LIVGKEEEIALGNAGGVEFLEAECNQRPAQAPAPPASGYGQVVEIAPAPVVSAQDGTHQLPATDGDRTHSRISSEEGGDRSPGVGFIEADPLGSLPEFHHSLIIGDSEGAQADV